MRRDGGMNTLYLRYAVEVAQTGSFTQAARNLYLSQPRLSKAIRELERHFGAEIFDRTAKGVVPTPQGEAFLARARAILDQVDQLEGIFQAPGDKLQRLSVSVPRASYISQAFIELSKGLSLDHEVDYKYWETSSSQAIRNVVENQCDLAVVRFQTVYEPYFMELLEEKDLLHRTICEFDCYALMSARHPLADRETVAYSELKGYIELVHGDFSVPMLSPARARQLSHPEEKKREIAIYERGSQLELLSGLPTTYMWGSPLPQRTLERMGLVQKRCDIAPRSYRDILVYRRGHRFTPEEESFIQILTQTADSLPKE
jgi:DNA-binding transcriptional LysR family regulator